MAEKPDFSGLGRRLFGGAASGAQAHPVDDFLSDDPARIVLLPIGTLKPNPDQPRTYFDPEALDDLTASIRERGVLQPVIARKDPAGDGYFLIAGERRWRAATAAGLAKIPALIRQHDDPAELALIENLQREDLNALEEAESLLRLKERRGFTVEELAHVIGKSRQAVSESLTLNQLPEEIKVACRTSGTWSKSQLLTVVRAQSPDEQIALWEALRTGQLRTVRELRQRNRIPRVKVRRDIFTYQPPDRRFRVTIRFSKGRVASEDIKDALQEALNHHTK